MQDGQAHQNDARLGCLGKRSSSLARNLDDASDCQVQTAPTTGLRRTTVAVCIHATLDTLLCRNMKTVDRASHLLCSLTSLTGLAAQTVSTSRKIYSDPLHSYVTTSVPDLSVDLEARVAVSGLDLRILPFDHRYNLHRVIVTELNGTASWYSQLLTRPLREQRSAFGDPS